MTSTNADQWAHLTRAYEQAREATDAANDAYERDAAGYSDEHEALCDSAREAELDLEGQLLAMSPPDLSAVAYQLRLFALRHCGVEIDSEPTPSEEPEGPILRRIHEAILAAV